MPKNGRPFRDDTWRERIQTLGEIELTGTQLRSIEILLKKTIPDLKSVEHYGKDGGAIQHEHNITDTDKAILARYEQDIINKYKKDK